MQIFQILNFKISFSLIFFIAVLLSHLLITTQSLDHSKHVESVQYQYSLSETNPLFDALEHCCQIAIEAAKQSKQSFTLCEETFLYSPKCVCDFPKSIAICHVDHLTFAGKLAFVIIPLFVASISLAVIVYLVGNACKHQYIKTATVNENKQFSCCENNIPFTKINDGTFAVPKLSPSPTKTTESEQTVIEWSRFDIQDLIQEYYALEQIKLP